MYLYVYMCVNMYTNIPVYICVCIYNYKCICAYIFTCVYTRIVNGYAYIHTYMCMCDHPHTILMFIDYCTFLYLYLLYDLDQPLR